jgi:hypothetical protein
MAMNDRPMVYQLDDIAANHEGRFVMNPDADEVMVDFGGDNVQANNFEKLMPDFVPKRRFAERVTIDLKALEKNLRGCRRFHADEARGRARAASAKVSLPRKLKTRLAPNEVRAVPEMGWAGQSNGASFRLAKGEFEVELF